VFCLVWLSCGFRCGPVGPSVASVGPINITVTVPLKGLSHEIDFKNSDKNLQNLTKLRDAAGF